MKPVLPQWFAAIILLSMACGAGCPQFVRPVDPLYQAPVVFQAQPSKEELLAHVNTNTHRVQSLESTGATIGLKGFPSIRAQMYMMPPMKFRLIGETSLTGQLLDLGSNDDEFWVWGKGFNTPGLMYARHDQFQYTMARQMLPVEPSWVGQAMGLAEFDPNDFHQGPYVTASGHYEIRSTVSSPAGQVTKVTVIDKSHGYVLEQHIYDATGQPLASALASSHRYDPTHGVTLPYKVDIRLPRSGIDFTVNVIGYRINQLAETAGIFRRPQRPDVQEFNLAAGAPIPTTAPLPSGQSYASDQAFSAGQPLPSGQPLPTGQPYAPGQPYPTGQPAGQPLPGTGYPGSMSPPVQGVPSSLPSYPATGGYPLGSTSPAGAAGGAGVMTAVRPVYETAAQREYASPAIRGLH